MGFVAKSSDTSISCSRNGVNYDSESVTISSTNHNEISAYRTKREWTNIFHSSFLLQIEKDYKFKIVLDQEGSYTLKCCFDSPCGRYAFWRLINQQAPETEKKLQNETKVISNQLTFSERIKSYFLWNNKSKTETSLKKSQVLQHNPNNVVYVKAK